jgi:Uma2 family endonuclease
LIRAFTKFAGEATVGAERRTKGYSFDDFCALVKDGEKADLIGGVIYMASPDNMDANDLFVWLLRLLADIVEIKDLGKVNGSRAAYRVNQANSPEPDVAFIRRGRTNLVRRGFVNGPPDLAIEIVSPDSVERDYETKRDLYQDAGVQEYWIVDEVEHKVTLLRLAANGKYREVRSRRGELHSRVVPGFWLRPEWLWQRPLPKKTDVLALLLQRMP